jgi:hypothetical protein
MARGRARSEWDTCQGERNSGAPTLAHLCGWAEDVSGEELCGDGVQGTWSRCVAPLILTAFFSAGGVDSARQELRL